MVVVDIGLPASYSVHKRSAFPEIWPWAIGKTFLMVPDWPLASNGCNFGSQISSVRMMLFLFVLP